MARINKQKMKKQADKILELAQKYGIEQNYLFTTTFSRYLVQLRILEELENKIDGDGVLVTKEYVKNRENIYTHPAIGEFNKTATAANQTVATLIKIVKSMRTNEEDEDGEDDLLKALGVK